MAYGLTDYGNMIADRARVDAYAEALRRAVRPASVVLDLGAGTGILSLLACRAGARRVIAIEPEPVVQILLEAARANGCADRITIIQKRSADVALPERVDVIVSDLRGTLPAFQSHFADIIDARNRFLVPGGRMVPEGDTLWMAVASVPELLEDRRRPWESEPQGLDLRSALRYVDSAPEKVQARADQLLCEPVRWAEIDYRTLAAPGLRGTGTCVVSRNGGGHGLLAWFDATLAEGVGYSNAPGAATSGVYGQMFFPWPAAIRLARGDEIAFELRGDPIGSDHLWTWTSEIRRPDRGPEPISRFRQSTFTNLLTSVESLRRRTADFVPVLSAEGEALREVLEGIRGGATIGDLAGRLLARHPDRFRSLDEAHGFVAELADRYGV